ncbi:hypothetical protein JHW40_21240 (plasmid) [Paracoccus alcaliphilus]|nr:hypothetical protein [Paracoccus alcaliphilus]WCR20768.1 hypothetical protein JHW40_21240 [Paracoccus alcaliphilus]
MRRDSRLSSVLHALLHMAEHDGPMIPGTLGYPVVVRRTKGLLRDVTLADLAQDFARRHAQRRTAKE